MTKTKIDFAKAKDLLNSNELTSEFEIIYSSDDRVEAYEAIKLGKLGIDVPEDLIQYPEEITGDDDFEGEWTTIESDIADYKKQITISLQIDEEVETWLNESKVDLDKLVSELINGFYKSSKIVNED